MLPPPPPPNFFAKTIDQSQPKIIDTSEISTGPKCSDEGVSFESYDVGDHSEFCF